MRSCLKKMGPFESSLMINAMTTKPGSKREGHSNRDQVQPAFPARHEDAMTADHISEGARFNSVEVAIVSMDACGITPNNDQNPALRRNPGRYAHRRGVAHYRPLPFVDCDGTNKLIEDLFSEELQLAGGS